MGLDIQKFIESIKLQISYQLKPYSSVKPFEGRVSPVLGYLGNQGTLGKLGPNRVLIPQIMDRKIQKIISSLQLIISH